MRVRIIQIGALGRSHRVAQRIVQFGLALIALALVTLPLNVPGLSRESVLTPLRTTFTPFNASVEAPTAPAIQFSFAAISGGRVALAPGSTSYLAAPTYGRFSPINVDGHRYSTFVAFVSGRSPPLAS